MWYSLRLLGIASQHLGYITRHSLLLGLSLAISFTLVLIPYTLLFQIDLPNSVHAFQTAEAIRRAHPNEDWFHLTGLIHDMGKMMAFYGEPHVSGI